MQNSKQRCVRRNPWDTPNRYIHNHRYTRSHQQYEHNHQQYELNQQPIVASRSQQSATTSKR